MKLFDLFATLTLDTKDFNAKVDSAIDKGNELGDTMGTQLTAKAVAWGNAMYDGAKRAVSGIIEFGYSLVTTAAEVQAEQAQFASTFGDMGDVARGVFEGIGANTNIFATRLQTVGTKAFSQFKGAGLQATDAMGAMSKYLSLAADAAAYYDISLEDADTRLRSFLRGNVEAGDAIGLFTSAAQRDSYALERYGSKWQDLTEAQRQLLMLNIAEDIYKQSGAIGQAAKEGHSWANSLSNLEAVWRQIKATLGGPILDAVLPALEKLYKWLQENPEAIEALAESLGKIASFTADALISAFDWITQNGPAVVDTVTNIANSVLGFLGLKPKTTRDELSDFFLLENGRGRFVQEAYNIEVLNGNEQAVAFYEEFQKYLAANGLDIYAEIPEEDLIALYDQVKAKLSSTPFTVNVSGNWMGIGSWETQPEGRAVGMDYVPYDGYLALLHEGEGILTKSENTARLRGEGQGIDMRGLADEIKSAVREGLAGMSVNMDGQSVGNVVTKQVSRNIARQTLAGRFAT